MEKEQKLSTNCRNVFLLASIMFMLAILPFIIQGNGIFVFYGDYNAQQIPFYILAHRAVRNGAFLWNWGTDIGSGFLSSYSFYLLGSPFFWLTLLVKEGAIPYIMPFLMALKYGCAAMFAYMYLRRFSKSNSAAIIGALLYAFSGFQCANLVFQHFHDVVAFFPLLLYAMEDMIDRKRKGLFAVSVALCAIVNYYFFFGQVIFLLLYFLIRNWQRKEKKEVFGDFLRVLWEGIIGVLLSSFYLFPAVLGIASSSRIRQFISGWNVLLYPEVKVYFRLLKSLFLPGDLIARQTMFPAGMTYVSSQAVYLPLFAMVGVLCFAVCNRKHWAVRLSIVTAFMALVPCLNALFSALNTEYYARWFYMPILILCLLTTLFVDGLVREKERSCEKTLRIVWIVQLLAVVFFAIVAAVSPFVGGWFGDFFFVDHRMEFWMECGLAFLCVIFLGVFVWWKKSRRGIAIMSVTVLSCITVTYVSFAMGDRVITQFGKDEFVEQGIYGGAELQLPDDAFYRVETDGSSANYPMLWNLPAIDSFQSTVNPSIRDFYEILGIERKAVSDVDASMVGVRALLSTRFYLQNRMINEEVNYDAVGGMPGYLSVGMQNGHEVFENTYFIPMGFTFESYVTEETFAGYTGGNKDRLLTEYLVLTEEQKERYGCYLQEAQSNELYAKTEEEYRDSCLERRSSAAKEFAATSEGFRAVIEMERSNLVFFSVPYDRGFVATVDGEPVVIEKVDGGLSAVLVPAGEHEIQFTYHIYGLKKGIILSTIGLVLFVSLFVFKEKDSQGIGNGSKKRNNLRK